MAAEWHALYLSTVLLRPTVQPSVDNIFSRNKRAVGVEFVNDRFIRADADSTPRIVRAARLVVLSAGAMGTPSILERSGIGGSDILQKAGVQQIVDLPGVGKNYQGVYSGVRTWYFSHIAKQITSLLARLTSQILSSKPMMVLFGMTPKRQTVRLLEYSREDDSTDLFAVCQDTLNHGPRMDLAFLEASLWHH